jgi:hypothetical protein
MREPRYSIVYRFDYILLGKIGEACKMEGRVPGGLGSYEDKVSRSGDITF